MRVYKQSYTKPLPEQAKIISRKGKKYVKFKDVKGHTAEARLSNKGDKIRLETKHWHIEFEDNLQIRQDLKAYTNEKATQRLADRIQQLLNYTASNEPFDTELLKFIERLPGRIRDELISFGLLDANKVAAGKPLSEYIEGFKDSLTKKERDTKHIKATVGCLQRLIDGCGFKYWSDISGDKIIEYLDEQRDGGKGIGKRTYNGYIKAAKFFCKWIAKNLNTTSPIVHLEGLENEGTDKRHKRRAATADELRRLLETTRRGPERFGLTSYERSLLYWLAAETGLRANEIRTLTVKSFNFPDSTVTVDAAYSKHRQQDTLPLKAALQVALQNYLANKLPTVKVFYVTDKTCDMLKADLADAGIAYKDAAGCCFDFHAFRHTFITNLREAPPRVAQALARHKSSAMTDRYTHIGLHDERAALDCLPDLTQPSSESQQAVKTGTDDNFLSKSCFQGARRRTPVNIDDKKNTDSVKITPSGNDNKGSDETLNQQVVGSIPPSPNAIVADAEHLVYLTSHQRFYGLAAPGEGKAPFQLATSLP